MHVSLLGEFRVENGSAELPLPASRKARALLAFLFATARPHRRERLCEMFWDLPDDPRAALRWALSKLRQVVDAPDRPRIIADRERVAVDATDVQIDLWRIHDHLRSLRNASIPELEQMAQQLDQVPLDGLDGAGSDVFDAWLQSEREGAETARVAILRQLATHPDIGTVNARQWQRRWREADPEGAEAHDQATSAEGPADATQLRPWTRETEALKTQRIGFCEVRDGTKIAYATVGSGAPLLKAANWLTHLEFDWQSPIWGRSFAEIATGRKFIRYDERGCGLSDWDVKDLSFDAFVEDLETVADRLGLDRFPLLGISQGAAVSIEYAVRHPERVSALILVGGYAAGWRHMVDPEEHARREAVMALTEVGWGTDNPAYCHIFSKTFMPDASGETLDWFDELQRQTTSPRNAARFQDAFGHIDVRHRLAEVRAPTLVLHSKFDQRIPLAMGHALASGIPGAQFVPLDSRNHVLVGDEPAWQVCAVAVDAFLAELGL
ncbi:alpha/beta hydrolase [Pseudosulfitobacter koreensis]|uniref:Alpha/beta fold hydrolase n=1 Tax=Pseudosulfitobacter koreensis TaxID=2968472 RepID=A0ABT1Z497_9RHOB|nr:alpha/beta hydrolase [Pseudosulfitobacter koreense]MCR8827933.1 alpha/beta fold hydrolase [Pseudosulfitobacter koreense]